MMSIKDERIENLKSKKYILNAETNEIKEIPISDDYISKDKIKEKIEDLQFKMSFADEFNEDYYNWKIEVLEELLGE